MILEVKTQPTQQGVIYEYRIRNSDSDRVLWLELLGRLADPKVIGIQKT